MVLKDGTVVEVDNLAEQPEKSFAMDMAPILVHLDADEVEATWHTHPGEDPSFSMEDHDGFLVWPGLKHHIVGVRDGQALVLTYQVEEGMVVQCD